MANAAEFGVVRSELDCHGKRCGISLPGAGLRVSWRDGANLVVVVELKLVVFEIGCIVNSVFGVIFQEPLAAGHHPKYVLLFLLLDGFLAREKDQSQKSRNGYQTRAGHNLLDDVTGSSAGCFSVGYSDSACR